MTHTIAPPTLEELNERIDVLEANKVEWADFPNHVHVRKLNIELYCLYAVRDGLKPSRVYYHIIHSKDCAIHSYIGPALSYAPCDCGAVETRVDAIQSSWMDIETAPKDGSRILIAFANRHVCEAYWHKYWTNPCSGDVIVRTWRNDDDPISWMPLPVPPTQNTQNAKDPHNHGEGDQSVMPDRSGGDV